MPRKVIVHGSKKAQEYQKIPKSPTTPKVNSSFGVTGFEVQLGYDNLIGADEYNITLQGVEGIKIFNKMSRNDPTVAATLLLLEMPIITADWTIHPPDDATPEELEICEWVKWAIFEAPDQDFQTILRIALASLKFGFSLAEKIYEYDETGKLYIRKLAPRLQSTIWEWFFDKNENLTGFRQRVFSGEFMGDYVIPAWKTILFINRAEADSPKGQSILRAAYKPWVQKEKFEKYQAMQAMRHAVGVPKITAPPKFSPDDKDAAITLAKNLRAHQQAYAFVPSGWELEYIDQGDSKHIDLLPMIKYRDERIAVSVLAGFLNLGMTENGTKSLSENLSSIFLKNLQGFANYIADCINNKWIKDLIESNFPAMDKKRYPKLKVGGIVTDALLEYSQAINQVFSAGAITPDAETEDFVREKFKMPKKQENESDDTEPTQTDDTEPDKESNADEPDDKKAVEPKSKSTKTFQAMPSEFDNYTTFQKRPIRQNEKHVTWKAIEGTLDSSISQIVNITQSVKNQVIEDLRQQIIDALKSQQPSDAMKINVPDDDELRTAKAVKDILQELYDYGRQTIQDEKARQIRAQKPTDINKQAAELKKPPKIKKINPNKSIAAPQNAEAILEAMSVRLGQRVWQQVENTARDLTIAAIARGSANVDEIMAALGDLSSRAVETSARAVVPEAFGKGRAFEVEQLSDEIEYMQLSAALDQNTCEPCAALDREGTQYIIGSPEFYEFMPPLTQICDGGSRCRCIYIATFATSPAES
jgi:phage gp29-like protein